MTRPFVALHFALVQDVAVLRPLALLAASDPAIDLVLLVSEGFRAKDAGGIWLAELEELAAALQTGLTFYRSPFECLQLLAHRPGLIVAGSESDHPAHRDAHDLFRSVPGQIRTATLQHGLECIGFLHNRRHDEAIGRNVGFAADIVVSWFGPARLPRLPLDARDRLYVAGPTLMIDRPAPPSGRGRRAGPGLVCENLRTARVADAQVRDDFLDNFAAFAGRLAAQGRRLALRPHPASSLITREGRPLPANVDPFAGPLYTRDLGAFAFAISAPSTILFDLMLAGVPVAVWADAGGSVDAANFAGLTRVATAEDWWAFQRAATRAPGTILTRQARYLEALDMPRDVPARYRRLLAMAA